MFCSQFSFDLFLFLLVLPCVFLLTVCLWGNVVESFWLDGRYVTVRERDVIFLSSGSFHQLFTSFFVPDLWHHTHRGSICPKTPPLPLCSCMQYISVCVRVWEWTVRRKSVWTHPLIFPNKLEWRNYEFTGVQLEFCQIRASQQCPGAVSGQVSDAKKASEE